MNVFSLITGVAIVVLALVAIEARRLITSVIMLSAVGLLSVVLFVIMNHFHSLCQKAWYNAFALT
ncbi:protein of unknown function [Mesotoga infera]|uniref:Uncharacterized protein n=1 Tax=Mesotoga infera TaxID=1236046 RepID=A0A7Z7LE25_9BACT|nr:hypothetical protein [Mesotoga infera]SSC12277.1 protein of unknown function [Mesotoga infera]